MTDAEYRSPVFESLPYFDNDLELHPILKQKVDQELARELKKMPQQSLHPRLSPSYELFTEHPLLKAELERVESHQPLPPLDTVRYQLPAPTTSTPSEDEWQAALKNAKSQLEHQRIRQTNIALLQMYGANAWRTHNYLLESTVQQTEKALNELSALTTEVNRERKNSQMRFAKQLTVLETRWTELISNVLQIEMANVALEAELHQLAKREAELSGV